MYKRRTYDVYYSLLNIGLDIDFKSDVYFCCTVGKDKTLNIVYANLLFL